MRDGDGGRDARTTSKQTARRAHHARSFNASRLTHRARVREADSGPLSSWRIYGPDETLLALALREGSAELIAELAAGQHANPAAEHYGSKHERQLGSHFQQDMGNRTPGDWMFVRPVNVQVGRGGRP